jgi:hypoxanthine-DNA glycosylase
MKKSIESLPSVVDKNTTTLILGVMPGEESLKAKEYYADSRNKFWAIISSIYNGCKPLAGYQEKIGILKKNKIGLCCVLKCCEREGSLITAIHNETYNNVELLFKQYPNIKKIICNGKDKYYSKINCNGRTIIRLSSTSSSNTHKTLKGKTTEWKAALK